jgi:hypothetical protein
MALPYRTRRVFRGIGIALLFLALLLVLTWVVWLLWLDRYVVYTDDGAYFDFSRSNQSISGEIAIPPADDMTVSIYFNEGDSTLNVSAELRQLSGYYVDRNMLAAGIPEVIEQLKKLPPETPVMIELKDIVGRFFYNTTISERRYSGIDIAGMEDLFAYLNQSDLYTIAKIPALRDYYHGLENVSHGLAIKGGYLWMEPGTNCYWLNPSNEGTISYLMQQILEIKAKGFDEVILGDFRFPETTAIVFDGSPREALQATAARLLESCGTDRFAISFCVSDAKIMLPEGARSRMFFESIPAADVSIVADSCLLTDLPIKLAFITELKDTRFDDYGVLRPLTSAELEEK